MSEPTVHCAYFDKELPALTQPPLPGALGTRIQATISQPAWQAWLAIEKLLIKHFEFDPNDPTFMRRRATAVQEFFFGPPPGERLVVCSKFGRELPGLANLPFPGALGQRIYANVSQRAWAMWPEQERILINHYGMSLVDPQSQKVLLQSMEEFFFGEGAITSSLFAVFEGESRGRQNFQKSL
jgi:Fe-S cluster biosynthesis and repair protein YggX